jgi:tetrahydromethanopterin S-methyltransferase subunit G
MSDNVVLEHLRHIRGGLDALREDVRDVSHRLTSLEIQVSNFVTTETSHYAGLALRMDRTDDRLDRIERRLEIVPAA